MRSKCGSPVSSSNDSFTVSISYVRQRFNFVSFFYEAIRPFASTLHTHALSGGLHGKYASSLTYELRVVFKLNDDIVYLLDIGPHDEVY